MTTTATLDNLSAAQPVLNALASCGAELLSVSADSDKVLVLAYKWHPMYDDEVAISHAAKMPALVEPTVEVKGDKAWTTWTYGIVVVTTLERLPIVACECGKPIEHQDTDPDSGDWACRVPAVMLVRDCESFA